MLWSSITAAKTRRHLCSCCTHAFESKRLRNHLSCSTHGARGVHTQQDGSAICGGPDLSPLWDYLCVEFAPAIPLICLQSLLCNLQHLFVINDLKDPATCVIIRYMLRRQTRLKEHISPRSMSQQDSNKSGTVDSYFQINHFVLRLEEAEMHLGKEEEFRLANTPSSCHVGSLTGQQA